MLAGAGIAGGVALLSGVAWLIALLNGLNTALRGAPAGHERRQPLWALAGLSLALGVGAPLVARWLIQPVADQLQGGLTPHGAINIWPWIGLAASDAANRQVTALPSIALALLMLVLCALVYVVARLREVSRPADPRLPSSPAATAEREATLAQSTTPSTANEGKSPRSTLLDELRSDVPWLSVLLGASRRAERRRGDAE
jgi:hypothetical protein